MMLNTWPLAKDLQVLVEIVHCGSFSAAALRLGRRLLLLLNGSKSLKTRWQRRYLIALPAVWR